jgi:amino acid adenylation domain-containing protein
MTSPGLSTDSNLIDWFEHQVRLTPDAVAVIAGETTTYRELSERTLEVDSFLRARGLDAEEPVGVYMSRTAGMTATLLGILRSGGAYVPLDPDDPPERTRLILRQSNARVVVTDQGDSASSLLDPTEMGRRPVEFLTITGQRSPAPHPPAPGGSRLAYLIFTSGSTGEPKGVAVEHRSLINLLTAARDLLGFSSSDRFLAASTIGFDISVAELFLPLITGGSLVLRDRSVWFDPAALAGLVRQHGVTVMQTGPSTWSVLLAAMADFPRLRVAISTAEAISPALARKLASYGEEAWNLYGPTEATVWATAQRLSTDIAPHHPSAASASIGQPIAGTLIVILGEDGNAVRDGEVGELCLGGPGLARGYHRNEALTGERFIHWGPHSARYYRTGDLVSMNPDGTLDYIGRNDDQLKIRGLRIEPREVESAIHRHPSVKHVAATWYPSPNGSRMLMAAIIPVGKEPAAADLHNWLQSRLPPQMIPSRFIFCDSLPLSPAGKVDRNALRQLAIKSPANLDSRPLTPTEKAVADIWRRLLEIDTVAPDDHFFSIGGDSLAAVRMALEVESLLNTTLTVRTIFECPTLEQLAARLDGVSPHENSPTKFILPVSESSPGRPLFFNEVDLKLARRGLWRVPCPLYAVSHWAQGTGFIEADTIEELARRQIIGIRTVQPSGPYRIAGYSFGGLIAMEIAHQLEASGEKIDFLFLLDPMQPNRVEGNPQTFGVEGPNRPHHESRARRMMRHIRSVIAEPGNCLKYLGPKLVWHFDRNPLAQRMIYKIVHLHGRRPNPISYWLLPKNRWPAFWYSALRLARTHTAKHISGQVLAVFSTTDNRFKVWQEFGISEWKTHIVTTAHSALYDEPALTQWMQLLTNSIDQTGKPHSARSCRGDYRNPPPLDTTTPL